MTTVRTRATIAKTRRAFEEGKAAFCDENGQLVPAGKVFPSDAPADKEFLEWPLANDVDMAEAIEEPADPVPDLPEPAALPEPADLPEPDLLEPAALPEPDDVLEPAELPEEEPLAIEPDAPPLPELAAPPAPEPKPARKVRKLRPKKKTKVVTPPPPPQRRFLVINQALSQIAATPSPRKSRGRKPEPRATVTRHFKNPLLLNSRYPPSKVAYTTEYSNRFGWPVSPVRLQ